MRYRQLVKAAGILLLILGMLTGMQMIAMADTIPGQGIYEIRPVSDEGFVLDEKHCTEQEVSYDSLQLYRSLSVKQQEFYLAVISPTACRISSLLTGRYLTQTDVTGVNGGEITNAATGSVRMSAASFPAVESQPQNQGSNQAENAAAGQTGDQASDQTEDPAANQTGNQTGNKAADQTGDQASGQPTQPEIPADEQMWFPEEMPDGTYRFRSKSGLYLTLTEKRTCNGSEVKLAPLSGSKQQLWKLTPVPVYDGGAADTDVVNPYLEDGRLQDVKVTVRLQDTTDSLTAQTLSSWMISPDGHTLVLDEERLHSYVSYLAEHYNTVGRSRTFVTSYKVPITLSQGNYGWKMNEEATFQRLKEAVSRPGRCTVIPEWSQEGGDFYGTNSDIGDSYVEVDLNAQKVWLYKDGIKLVETDCVSGTAGTDRETPGGVYYIFYMQSPAVLNGADYSSPVTYWMPFNGNIGLHDASWRSEFGGDIYKTNGSHGCVNLPYEAAETIYKTVDIGYPVVCYR